MRLGITDIGDGKIIFSRRDIPKFKIAFCVSDLVVGSVVDHDIAAGKTIARNSVEYISFYSCGLGKGGAKTKQQDG
ncbi:hypothetical protein GCM10011511_21670 [Puia dinghuensis]|uniref:Uncharacterized protein n=1 Tax=Puia dinghuensis TaxID=1792502 RepID=A0A8J2XTC3_9BACT|nr:hypothetical protein GCM10011511_21670 [Puia dinghuensis]